MNFKNFDNSHKSFLWPEYFYEILIPCQAVTSVLCLHYHQALQYKRCFRSNNFSENPRKFLGIFTGNPRKFPGIFHRKIRWKYQQLFRGISCNPFQGTRSKEFPVTHSEEILITLSKEFLVTNSREFFVTNSAEKP